MFLPRKNGIPSFRKESPLHSGVSPFVTNVESLLSFLTGNTED